VERCVESRWTAMSQGRNSSSSSEIMGNDVAAGSKAAHKKPR